MPITSEAHRARIGVFCLTIPTIFEKKRKKCKASSQGKGHFTHSLKRELCSWSAGVSCTLAYCLFVLLLTQSMDVETNPGPQSNGDVSATDNGTPDPVSENTEPLVLSDSSTLANKILCAIQSIESQISQMNTNLSELKADVCHVKSKCEDIDSRCYRLENEHSKVLGKMQSCEEKIQDVTNTTHKQSQHTARLGGKVDNMEKDLASLKDEVDRLESFSRRDNLRFFGIPEGNNESYASCAKSVCDVLNSAGGSKTWSPEDDIGRAHRVGSSRDGGPKPMIVKFNRWKDKMSLIGDRALRERLQKSGVTLANDLTRNQARIVAEARKEGRVAYIKGGKMIIGPKRADNRSYADVVASSTKSSTEPTRPHELGDSPTRNDPVSEQRSPTGDSPKLESDSILLSQAGESPSRVDVSDPVSSQRLPARGAQDTSTNPSSRQAGIRQYCSGQGVNRPPAKSGPSPKYPRRSQRNSNAER